MIEGYLERSPRLAGVVSLIDGRHDPTALDRRMIDWLAVREIRTLFALTKADRVPRGRRRPRLDATAEALGVDADQIVWFSPAPERDATRSSPPSTRS
jgi:GTP-binding protein